MREQRLRKRRTAHPRRRRPQSRLPQPQTSRWKMLRYAAVYMRRVGGLTRKSTIEVSLVGCPIWRFGSALPLFNFGDMCDSIGAIAHFPMHARLRRPSRRRRKGPPPGQRRPCWQRWPRRRRRSPTLRKTWSTSMWCLSATSVCGLWGVLLVNGVWSSYKRRVYNPFVDQRSCTSLSAQIIDGRSDARDNTQGAGVSNGDMQMLASRPLAGRL